VTGQALLALGARGPRLADAFDDLEEAIRVYQTAVQRTPPDSPVLPMYLNNLGTGLSDRYARSGALADLEEAIRVYQTTVQRTPPDSPDLPMYLNNLGAGLRDRYARSGALADLEEARTSHRRACQRGLEVQPEATVVSSRSWGNWALGRMEWEEATAAYTFGRQAMDLMFDVQSDRAAKESWLKEAQGLPGNAAYALAKLGRLEEALETIEAGRARLLAETLEQNRRDLERLPQMGYPELLERYRQATGRIQFLQQQAGQRAEQRQQQPGSFNLIEKMEQARVELNATIAAIRQVQVDGERPYADFLLPPTFAKIRQAAAPGAPLAYLLTTPAGSLALIVDDGQVKPLWLDGLSGTQLREALFGPADDPELGGYFGAYDHWSRQPLDQAARRAWFEALDATAHWLWDALVGPLVDHLETKGIQQAAVIAGGSLGLLPLHTAWTLDPAAPTGRRYALDTLSMAYAPSASAVVAAREVAGRVAPDAVLAVDNPDGSLLFSGQEVEAVLSYFPGGKRKPLRGRIATRQATLREVPSYPVLHFSTHGWAGWDEPLEGGLLMAGEGALILADLLDLRLEGARLAVLSACETGIPGTKLPDEVVSLPTGLVQAGVAGVVASLWSVNDLSTAMLMERFYRLWKQDGLAPSEALRKAQIWLRDTTKDQLCAYLRQRLDESPAMETLYQAALLEEPGTPFGHPYYWAGFTYTGV
jgi:CHAT domain-containing protein